MAAPVAALAVKAGISVATDPELRKIALWLISIVIAMIIMPLLLVSSMLHEAASVDYTDESVTGLIGERMSAGDLVAAAQIPRPLPGSIHQHIGQLVAADDTVFSEGPWVEPLHRADYLALITSGYGSRADPFTGEMTNHTGLDFGVSSGAPVYAVKPGKVIIVERSGSGYGSYVVIAHGNGYASLYGHLSSVNVSQGQTVDTNTIIARSGNSGRSTGPHLHLEIIKDGAPQNPTRYI